MQRRVALVVVAVAVGALAAGVYVIAGLPGLPAPDAAARDVIRTTTGVFSALVAPLALWVAWRSSLISSAALRNQTAPLIVDVPRGSRAENERAVVTVAGRDRELAASESRVFTKTADGEATGYGLALALRNVGNGVAQVDLACFYLAGKRIDGTIDRAVVPKEEAFRLVFEVNEVNDRAAFREKVLADMRMPPINVTYSDAARRMTALTIVQVCLGEEHDTEQWDAVVDKVFTSASQQRPLRSAQ